MPGLQNKFVYTENISAAYAILGNKVNKFSYQVGIRGELTDIQTELVQTKEKNPRNYANLFPSAHLTYNCESGKFVPIRLFEKGSSAYIQ